MPERSGNCLGRGTTMLEIAMRVYRTTPLSERFWPKVQKTESCWLWTAAKHNFGYGKVGSSNGDILSAHRVAYEWASGHPIPDGMFVCHDCPDGDNPACVRNDTPGWKEINGVLRPKFGHLWLGTLADNMADMAAKGRASSGDRNNSRLHPERVQRGDNHWSHRRPDLVRIGTKHHSAKLTEDNVLEIRRIWAEGDLSLPQIGAMFGTSGKHVWEIVHRHTWKHLP